MLGGTPGVCNGSGWSRTTPFAELQEGERLFKPERIGSSLERLLVNLGMMITSHREGGFFITIARKPVGGGPVGEGEGPFFRPA